MNNVLSIDAMIKAGKTLPEIQTELRKIVAARDEAALKAQKDAEKQAKVKEARSTAVKALADYCIAIGVPFTERNDLMVSFNKALDEYEKELTPWLKVIEKVPAEPKSRSTLDTLSLEDALAQLRSFADSL
jgi:hypothetical protein